MSGLRVVAGLDLDQREARKDARRRAAPLLRKWKSAIRAHARLGLKPKLLIGDSAFADEMLNFPSANFGYCYAGQTRLGDTFGVSRHTALRALARLKDAGFLICKRGGQGRTSRWSFAIAGSSLFSTGKTTVETLAVLPQEVAPVLPQEVARMLPQEVAPVLLKPYEQSKPSEPNCPNIQPAGTPAPPPMTPPREARRIGKELSTELLSGLTRKQGQHPRWRGLSTWIADQLEDGVDKVDVACGIAIALPSLKGEPPSSLEYFRKPIERARLSRIAGVADADGRRIAEQQRTAQPVVSLDALGTCDPGDDRWNSIRRKLTELIGRDAVVSWFSDATLGPVTDTEATVLVNTRFKAQYIAQHFDNHLLIAVRTFSPLIERVRVAEAKRTGDV